MKPMTSSIILRFLSCFALFMLLSASNVEADATIAVVANRNSKIADLSKQQVADLYLGKRKTVNDDITVISLDSNEGNVRERFYQAVADMTIVRLNAYWSKIVFSGLGRPPLILSLQDAMARIASDPNAIAYFSSDHVASDMKVLFNVQ